MSHVPPQGHHISLVAPVPALSPPVLVPRQIQAVTSARATTSLITGLSLVLHGRTNPALAQRSHCVPFLVSPRGCGCPLPSLPPSKAANKLERSKKKKPWELGTWGHLRGRAGTWGWLRVGGTCHPGDGVGWGHKGPSSPMGAAWGHGDPCYHGGDAGTFVTQVWGHRDSCHCGGATLGTRGPSWLRAQSWGHRDPVTQSCRGVPCTPVTRLSPCPRGGRSGPPRGPWHHGGLGQHRGFHGQGALQGVGTPGRPPRCACPPQRVHAGQSPSQPGGPGGGPP